MKLRDTLMSTCNIAAGNITIHALEPNFTGKIVHYKGYANSNASLPCPGLSKLNNQTFLENLEWYSVTKQETVAVRTKEDFDFPNTLIDPKKNIYANFDNELVFRNLTSADRGDYICLINHGLLKDVMIRFNVIDVPDPPGRPLITYFAARSANLSWTPPKKNDGNITNYTVVIRKHIEKPDLEEDSIPKSTNFTTKEVETLNNKTSFHVENLRPYTVYSFQIIAWNEMGPSNFSKPSYFMVTLREVPEARIPFTARNVSDHSVFLSWNQPNIDYVNGDFLGYRLTWRPLSGNNLTEEKYIRNSSVTAHKITNLRPHTSYHIGLSVFNPEGFGPNTTLLIRTDEGIPSPPRNLTVINVTDTTMTLQWIIPEQPNGVIKGYRIYYDDGVNTLYVTDKSDLGEFVKTFVLTNLVPDKKYALKVKCFNHRNEGNFSEVTVGRTDIKGPSPPILTNVSCEYNNSILVEVSRPTTSLGVFDEYYIDVYESGLLYKNMILPTEKGFLSASYIFRNVTPRLHYSIQVYAAARSGRTGNYVIGEKSRFKTVFVTEGCHVTSEPFTELWAGILAGFLCAVLVLVLGGGSYLVWKRYLQPPYYYLDNTHCAPAALDWNNRPPPRNEADAANDENDGRRRDYSGPIEVGRFHDHVQRLHADGDIGFSREYDSIQNDPTNEGNSSENSQHPDNKPKNRYLNIIAYDHSRVQLLPMPGQKISTYINANYIDGFLVSKAYIGTQGPLPSTFDCFWRMIWEQRVTIIVMITNLVERGRRKCDMYWPKEGSELYGFIQVKLVKEDVMATYTVRTLVIRHTRVSIPGNVKRAKDISMAEKTVYQYHYTNWPDHGTPDHPLPVISFVKKSSLANPPDSGPIVVHCSAGVGRTGTYIVIDAMLRQIKARGEVNVFGFLKHIRAQRNFLVQTEEQYIFIHDALLEAIDAGETDIPREQFARYVEVLQNPDSRSEDERAWKVLDEQFQQVIKFKPRDFNLVSANKPVNQKKNRCAVLVPIESARVHLTPRPGEDGSDYVNASWLPGFHSLREFIITQHPIAKEEFWKMCWDHTCQLVVMLSIIDGEEFEKFWPEADEVIKTDVFTCVQANVNKSTPFITREFLLKSLQDDFEIRTKFVQSLNWPHQGVASIKNMYDLPNYVTSLQKENQGPVCIVDRFGGTEAATFCALVTLKRHLAYEQKVDIYMYAKLYHNKRPGLWLSVDDYMKLHLCVQTVSSEPEKYLEEVPPDLYTLANGVSKTRTTSNCSGKSSNYSDPQPGYSRSPDGYSASVAVTIEQDGERPSTSKDVGFSAGSLHDSKNDLERVPPEVVPLLGNLETFP
ncbi:tyrosine-protein phosphatase 99A isoform X3 [Dendroctonus ponderosae]|uniref:tyrosine-protein phosphatase 99A isoform X3 n=1 Tax=Dendroctonus ponderosae TaxID=77166 RepID=UPI002035BDDD|nr:tyrosine-protein phosphatase 99A isoform X3 [Dendroctonus ponderosae]